MNINYNARRELADKVKPGDIWKHRKTGLQAKVLTNDKGDIELQHESGRVTFTRDHYFASRFEPSAP